MVLSVPQPVAGHLRKLFVEPTNAPHPGIADGILPSPSGRCVPSTRRELTTRLCQVTAVTKDDTPSKHSEKQQVCASVEPIPCNRSLKDDEREDLLQGNIHTRYVINGLKNRGKLMECDDIFIMSLFPGVVPASP